MSSDLCQDLQVQAIARPLKPQRCRQHPSSCASFRCDWSPRCSVAPPNRNSRSPPRTWSRAGVHQCDLSTRRSMRHCYPVLPGGCRALPICFASLRQIRRFGLLALAGAFLTPWQGGRGRGGGFKSSKRGPPLSGQLCSWRRCPLRVCLKHAQYCFYRELGELCTLTGEDHPIAVPRVGELQGYLVDSLALSSHLLTKHCEVTVQGGFGPARPILSQVLWQWSPRLLLIGFQRALPQEAHLQSEDLELYTLHVRKPPAFSQVDSLTKKLP